MRILLVHPGPNFSVHDVFAGWREALTDLGVTLAVYNLDERLTFYDSALIDTGHQDSEGRPQVRKAVTHEQAMTLAAGGLMSACYQFWPDVVVCISAFFTPPAILDIMRARRHRVVLVHTESPYQDQEQLVRAEHADINLLNDPTNLAQFRDVCKHAEYVPHAYRPSVHRPGRPSPRLACDLAFVGTGYQSRIDFFEAMNLDGLDVLLAGNWSMAVPNEVGKRISPLGKYLAHDPAQCLDNDQAVNIYRSAKAGINFYRREAETDEQTAGWAMGPREVEMAATGLFFLRDKRPESDEVFPMLPSFVGPKDASHKLRWYLEHDNARGKAAEAAQLAVADRTFQRNAARLLRIIDTVS